MNSNQQSAISNQRRLRGFHDLCVSTGGWLLAAGCWLLTTGCVERSLTIRSEPPGAQAWVNDELLGTTPYTYDFQWYGWYRVTLIKPGYAQLEDRRLLNAPPQLWIPLDLMMELLPWTLRDARELSYHLIRQSPRSAPTPPAPEPATSPSTDGTPTEEHPGPTT